MFHGGVWGETRAPVKRFLCQKPWLAEVLARGWLCLQYLCQTRGAPLGVCHSSGAGLTQRRFGWGVRVARFSRWWCAGYLRGHKAWVQRARCVYMASGGCHCANRGEVASSSSHCGRSRAGHRKGLGVFVGNRYHVVWLKCRVRLSAALASVQRSSQRATTSPSQCAALRLQVSCAARRRSKGRGPQCPQGVVDEAHEDWLPHT